MAGMPQHLLFSWSLVLGGSRLARAAASSYIDILPPKQTPVTGQPAAQPQAPRRRPRPGSCWHRSARGLAPPQPPSRFGPSYDFAADLARIRRCAQGF